MKKLLDYIKQLSFYNTLRHGSVYMFSFVAAQAITIVSIPVFTKLLTPADFGVYEVYNNTVRFLSVLLSLNLYTGFYRYYFDDAIDNKHLMQFLLRISFVSFIIGVFFLIIFEQPLLSVTNLPPDVFIWIPIGIFTTVLLNFFTSYNNAQQYSTRAGVWQLAIQLLKTIMSIGFILFVSKNYLGRISGEYTITFIASLIIIAVYFRNYIGLKETLPDKKQILQYSTSFIPISMSGYIISYMDLVLINNIQGNTASGVYSYAYKFAIIYSGLSQSFVTANRPNLFNLLKENKTQEVVGQMRSMFKLITVLASVFILFAADAGKILSLKPEFGEALYLLPILIMGYVFSDIAEVYNFFLYYSKKVKLFYVSFVFTALVNFVLNLLLIPKYGYQVAAYTTLISYIVLFAATYLVCKFYTQLTVPRWTLLVDYLAILAVVIAVSYLLPNFIANFWLLIIVKIAVFMLLSVFLFLDKIKNIVNN